MTSRNQEKLWKAEQKAAEEERKLEQLRKEKEEERELQDLARIQEAAGLKKPSERLEWMYNSGGPGTSGAGGVDDDVEDYLLGRKRVDTLLERKSSVEPRSTTAANTSFDLLALSNANANSERDTLAKQREDPMFLMKQQEMAMAQKLLNNPLYAKRLEALRAKREGQTWDSEKKVKKHKKDKKHKHRSDGERSEKSHRRRRSRSRSSSGSPRQMHTTMPSPDPTKRSELDRQRSKYTAGPSSSRDRPKSLTTSTNVSNDHHQSHHDTSRHSSRHSTQRSDGHRSSHRHRQDRSVNPDRSSRRHHYSSHRRDSSRSSTSPRPHSHRSRRSTHSPSKLFTRDPLPDSVVNERANRLQEMLRNAEELEHDRKQRLAEDDRHQAEREIALTKSRAHDNDPQFITELQTVAYSTTSDIGLADRIRRNRASLRKDQPSI
ncbi:RNA-splicing factor [Dispira simplex]|nr:RNA-splicing factor [Dispira simplex]